MKNTLIRETIRKTLYSVGIFAALFVVLWVVELLGFVEPGRLLQWSNAAFVVGIPASILGVAYVLIITNPKNYMGFYLGVVMSVLLGVKFYLQDQLDLLFLYIVIFIPFQLKSLIEWRRNTLALSGGTISSNDSGDSGLTMEKSELRPRYLDWRGFALEMLGALLMVVADFVFVYYYRHKVSFFEAWPVTLAAGVTIAASFFSNFLMIYQTNDAWMWWVVYSVASVVLFVLCFDPFMLVLNLAFLVINGSAHIAWIRMTRPEDFGWGTFLFARKR